MLLTSWLSGVRRRISSPMRLSGAHCRKKQASSPIIAAAVQVLEDRTLLSSVVTNTADSGAGSLRQAILDADANPGTTITFDIPGGPATIDLATALPDLTGHCHDPG